MPAAPGARRSAIRSSPLLPLTVRVSFETDADVAAAAGPAVARPAASSAAAAPAANPSQRTPSLLFMMSPSPATCRLLVLALSGGSTDAQARSVLGRFRVSGARAGPGVHQPAGIWPRSTTRPDDSAPAPSCLIVTVRMG